MRQALGFALLALGLSALALVSYTLLTTGTPSLALRPAAVTQPIIVDPGTGLVAPGPLASPSSREKTLEGARVRVPQLGIDLPIVEGDGQNVPLNVAAHYPGMLWPGQGGRSLLYAHARTGMFGPLFSAKVGQRVEIQTSDGRVFNYVIKEYHPRWPDTDLSILQPADHEQLVLLTCTSWNSSDPKIIAIAEPV